MDNKKDIFISYKAEEFEEADWVKSVLEQNGISCWMAPSSIKGGSSYASEIPQAIRECKVFVLILSEKAQESKWVPKEIDQAINENKIILPFMLENCKLKDDFNFYLSNVQRYEAYRSKSKAIEKMLSEIRAILGIPDKENEDDAEKIQENFSENDKENASPVTKPVKQKKVKKPRKKRSKKSKSTIVAIAALIVIVPIIALVCNSIFLNVTICGEKFKRNVYSVNFSEESKVLTLDDINKIKGLKNLSILKLDNCQLPDGAVTELLNLDLSSLSLRNCDIDNSDLEGLTISGNSADSLNLNDNHISDLSALIPLSSSLSYLYLDNNPISDLSALTNFDLKAFSIKNIGLTDITPVACLTQLKELYIDDNNVVTLEPLSVCENLEIISVNNNSISNFNGLEHSLKLSEVFANGNKINSLKGLENATVLSSLSLNDNLLNDISVIPKSKDTLQILYLNDNKISDISLLSECTALKQLYINDNSIATLQPLLNCKDLQKISAKNNNLTSLTGLENAMNLSYINFSDNSITDVSSVKNIVLYQYKSLYLDLRNNNLKLLEIPNVDYSYLNISGNDVENISSLSDKTISKLIFDYSYSVDYSALTENSFYNVYIVDCPLDRQLELAKVFGEYNTEFISVDEIDDIKA